MCPAITQMKIYLSTKTMLHKIKWILENLAILMHD